MLLLVHEKFFYQNNYFVEEGDDEIFLVDFTKKVNELEADDESKRFLLNKFIFLSFYYKAFSNDSLKIKNEVNEDIYYEQLRVKWEKEKLENIEKEEIHYQDIKYDGNFLINVVNLPD